jgi:hypothetical protein
MGNEFEMFAARTMVELLRDSMTKLTQVAIKEGMSPKEYLVKEGINDIFHETAELGELMNKIGEDVPGRNELFEEYENLLEDIEKITSEEYEHPLNKLIPIANQICKESFMNSPDYDEDNPITTIEEALAVLVMEALPHDADISGEDVYDFIAAKA